MSEGGERSLADELRDRRDVVLQRWTDRVLADGVVPEANRLSQPVLMDHVPQIFDAIVAALRSPDAPRATIAAREYGHGAGPAAHARDRLAEGYSTRAALRELSHFRTTIIEMLEEVGAVDANAAKIVNLVLDEAMSIAAETIDFAIRGAILEEQRRLRDVLELLPVGVFVFDANGAILETNAAAKSFWGVTPQVGSVKDYTQYEAYWTSTGERVKTDEWAAARALSTRKSVGPQELEIVASNGERRTILNSATPLLDDTGRVYGGLAVNIDITERRRMERTLHEALEKERAANEELGREASFRERFVGVLGHDLRTPLTAINVGAATLRRSALNLTQMRVAERIASAALRMDRMIVDLLDVTRARQGGGLQVFPKAVRLDAICRGVLDEIELAYPNRSVHLDVRGDSEGMLDADRMAQVVTNLVTNALEYSPSDTAVRVELEGTSHDEIRLTIHNEGAPIARESLPSLFDPFTRGATPSRPPATSHRRRGLGLGLYIVDQIVRAHGGSIGVRSDADAGTTFEVRLPRATVK